MVDTIFRAPVVGSAGRLHVDDGGEGGIPVVLLHSFGGSVRQWSPQLDHLRKSRRAVAIDLRGHGQSDPPTEPGDYAVTAMADDVSAALDALALDRVVLVGHSLGGSVAVAFAGHHPDRVAGLVLEGTPGRMPEDQERQTLEMLRSDYDKANKMAMDRLLDGATPESRTIVLEDAGEIGQEDGLAIIEQSFAYDPRPALGRFDGPVLIIDPDIGDAPWAIHRLVPNARREIVKGASHWVQLDQADQFNAILDRFLASIR